MKKKEIIADLEKKNANLKQDNITLLGLNELWVETAEKLRKENGELKSRFSNQAESIRRLQEENRLLNLGNKMCTPLVEYRIPDESMYQAIVNENIRLKKEFRDQEVENEKLKSEKYCSVKGFINFSDLVTINDLKKEIEQQKLEIDKYYDKNKHINALNDLLEEENKELKEQMKGEFSAWCDGFILGHRASKEAKANKGFWRIFK